MVEDKSKLTPAERVFAAALGEAIVEWNCLEGSLRGALVDLMLEKKEPVIFDILRIKIMTLELNNVGIEQALKSFAENILTDILSDKIKHAVLFFERLRAYRNYYVHGVTGIMGFTDAPSKYHMGRIDNSTAKGKLVQYRDWVTVEQLYWFVEQCIVARNFVAEIRNHISMPPGHPFLENLESWPLPDSPALPSPLEKTAQPWSVIFPADESRRDLPLD